MYQYYQETEEPSHLPYYVLLFVIQAIAFCVLANYMSTVMQRVSGDLRSTPAAYPWLSVIPFFGNFWIFYMVQQTGNMLQEEFTRRKIVEFETTPGLITGWGFAFTLLVAELTLLVDIPVFTIILYLAAVVQLILYCTKLAGFRSKLDQDLMRQNQQAYSQQSFGQQSYSQQWQQPNYQQPQAPPTNYFPPQNDFPPPPQSPPADEWDRWKPK